VDAETKTKVELPEAGIHKPVEHKRPGAPSIARFAMGGIANTQPALIAFVFAFLS
jgi:hypothetical protein